MDAENVATDVALEEETLVSDSDGIPEILKILNAPGLVDACDRILGKDWAVVPFTHNAPFISGAFDQHWHKDDNAPYNGRKQRHHQSIQLEMLYQKMLLFHFQQVLI